MGMDLFSVRRDRESKEALYFRFNWHGWSSLCSFLQDVGCDLSDFRGSNDGDIVPPESCLAIAEKLQEAWDAGKLVEYWGIYPLAFGGRHKSKTKIHGFTILHTGVKGIAPRRRSFLSDSVKIPTGSCWMADHKNNVIIPPKNPYPRSLNYVLKCRPNRLPLVMGVIKKEISSRQLVNLDNIVDMGILEARLKGETYDPARHIKLRPDLNQYDADDEEWSMLGYYLAFGKYCERCSHLGGFKQC